MNHRDRRDRRAVIGLEALEGRKLLATAGGLIAPLKGDLTHGLSYLDLQGTVRGVPSTVVGNPDVGTTVNFKGAGNVRGVGQAKLTGSLHGTGFIASSRVEGTITLSNGKGSVTLRLVGASRGGFTAPGSGNYAYTLTKSTGAFRHDFGSGTVVLALGSRSFSMTFHGNPNVY